MIPASVELEYEVIRCQHAHGPRSLWLLRDRASRRESALKICPADSGELLNEYCMLTILSGEGIPACYRYWEEEGTAFLLREYVPGDTLAEYAKASGGLPAPELIRIGRGLCRIVGRLHAQQPPVIHRDLKPENVIRTADGHLVLIDLGIARRYEANAPQDTQVLGTPAVAPPEQYGFRQTDARSDVFALGRLLQEIAGDHKLPAALSRVLERCTRFDPSQRFQSVAQLDRALSRLSRPHAACLAAAALGLCALLVFSSTYPSHFVNSISFPSTNSQKSHSDLDFPSTSSPSASLDATSSAFSASAQPARSTFPPVEEDFSAPSPTPSPIPSPAPTAALHADGTYTFASASIEWAVREQLGKPYGAITREDLSQVYSLILCGREIYADFNQFIIHGQSLCYGKDTLRGYGDVSTLEDIPFMPNLRTLALCNQQITDLSPLAGTNLQFLALHGNQIEDVSPLASCPQLLNVYLSNNPISDFSPLAACSMLWRLNVGATKITDLSSFSDFPALIDLGALDCPRLSDISAAMEMEQLSTLHLRPVSAAQLQVVAQLTHLDSLYLWHVETLTDLSPLSSLSELTMLYLYAPTLQSLLGIEGMKSLSWLSISGAAAHDLAPLAHAQRLTTLQLEDMVPVSWAPLRDLPFLQSVTCMPSQADAIRALDLGVEILAP